ncbi:unnamed protein product [Mytilus edulis]|uniref:CCHC-type domain-containing protein n=1 Tax=Mytilus edulis TaxID=6550 RepID=A0A8S3UEU0_MYTED|nr:unnamed protein product [Mytilus edulis]
MDIRKIGINNKDSIKYTTYHIKYSCAFCIIRKENIFERATNITKTVHNQLNNTDKVYPTPQTTVNDTNQSSQQSINITCKPKQKSFKEVTEDILIVDNIKEPEKCKTSTDIRKEISKKEKGSNIIQFSYKLPLGGIALHFPSSEEKKKFKERDAKEVFGEDSVAHNPASHFHKQNIIGFAKNIPLNLNLDKLKSEIEYQTGGNISEICRLHFWDTKRPMKVVKIFFDSPSHLDKSLNIEIANVSNNITKKIKVEKKRNVKFIRCYNCQYLGHPANQCQDKNIVTTVDQIPVQKLSVQSQLPVETVKETINRHRLTAQPSFALSTNINLKLYLTIYIYST